MKKILLPAVALLATILLTSCHKTCTCINYNGYGTNVSEAASAWGFSAPDGTMESFAAQLEAAYGADVANMVGTENAGSTVDDLFPGLADSNKSKYN